MNLSVSCKSVKEKYSNMKVSGQCRIAGLQGNQVIGMITTNLAYIHFFIKQ